MNGRQMVILGSGDYTYESFFRERAARHPGMFGLWVGFVPDLARKVYAGADMFLMPSKSEPCGLAQMVALRYGTVPVVRGTGGLDDTVVDALANPDEGTGYKFVDYTPEAFITVLAKAVSDYSRPDIWNGIVHRAMSRNYSWDMSAEGYEEVYARALALAAGRVA